MSGRHKGKVALTAAGTMGRAGPRQFASLAAAASLIALVKTRKRVGLPSGGATLSAFAVAPTLAAGFRRSRVRDGIVWAAQMWAYKNAFEMPNDNEQRLGNRAHFDYPLAVDARLGGGLPLGQRLQRRLRRRGELTPLDKAATFFYWTWEAEPHLSVIWIRWRRPEHFTSAAGRLAATFDLTLLGYWAIPTAPPWWVSEKLGRMDRDVRRVMSEVARWIKGEPNPTEGDHEIGANPFAAMPSDHFASAAMTAMLLQEQSPLLGAIGWIYALTLAFVLIYLGEHYLTDELVGLLLALAVNRFRQPLECAAERVLELGPHG